MLHTLKTSQFVKSDLETVWKFISSPKNLATITPPKMGFEIINQKDDLDEMYAGQIIEYYVRPILGIKMHWVTEITHVKINEYFVDEQRFGPYAFWHHKHFLKEVIGGVEMTDIIHYKAPFWIFGKIANAIIIKKQLESIFDFRFNKMNDLFQ